MNILRTATLTSVHRVKAAHSCTVTSKSQAWLQARTALWSHARVVVVVVDPPHSLLARDPPLHARDHLGHPLGPSPSAGPDIVCELGHTLSQSFLVSLSVQRLEEQIGVCQLAQQWSNTLQVSLVKRLQQQPPNKVKSQLL